MLASHDLNHAGIAKIPGSTLFIETLGMLHDHLGLHPRLLCNIPQASKQAQSLEFVQ